MTEKVSIVSLGCARNLVDTEVMAGLLRRAHYEVIPEPAKADVILINTCSFIDAAKEEQVPEQEKERRWQELMELQAGISRRKNEALIGTVQRVMINSFDPEAGMCFGRTQAHAPEVDGVVYLDCGLAAHGRQKVLPGHFADIRITQALDYDLIGEIHG